MNVGTTADQSSVTRAAVRFGAARRGGFFAFPFFISTMFAVHFTTLPAPVPTVNFKRGLFFGEKTVFKFVNYAHQCVHTSVRGFFSGMLRKNVFLACNQLGFSVRRVRRFSGCTIRNVLVRKASTKYICIFDFIALFRTE